MFTKIRKMIWDLHCYKEKVLLNWGLNNGLVSIYNDELIEKLRNVYYGGLPASVILLYKGMTNGRCYDCALLLSRAFLESEDDVSLIYASVDSLKLNPINISDNSVSSDHCFVLRKTKDGRHLIYDTTIGFIYDERLYWLIENPKIRKINSKESIKKHIEALDELHSGHIGEEKYISTIMLPLIERSYGNPHELYSAKGIELLQREVEHYKKVIDYDAVCVEVNEDMKRLGLIKKEV